MAAGIASRTAADLWYSYKRMNLLHLARNPPRWLRALLASLMLVLALDSLAHVQHRHGHEYDGRPGVEAALCGFCVAFDRMADGPSAPVFAIAPVDPILHASLPEVAPPSLPIPFRLVPRGPPAV
jgi:hypothetical protein